MARKGIKWKRDQFEALREDKRIHEDLIERAKKIAAAAGGEGKGYIVRENLGRDHRSGATVLATGHAHWSNRKHQSLIKALPEGK